MDAPVLVLFSKCVLIHLDAKREDRNLRNDERDPLPQQRDDPLQPFPS